MNKPHPDSPSYRQLAGQFASYPSLRGRAVLITGGATGIGESLVRHFAHQGSRVAFLDIQDEPAHRLVDDLIAQGCPAPLYLPCDLSDVPALQTAVKQVLDTFGTIDVLVNNAANDQRHSIEEVTPEYWDKSIAVNLRPQFFTIQAVLPAMRAQQRGSIINMSSISWMIPSTGVPLYIAAKAAIVGLTRTLAHELGPFNIRVNAVSAGPIKTLAARGVGDLTEMMRAHAERAPLHRNVDQLEVGGAALFLASDLASAITGEVLYVDSGYNVMGF